MKRLDWWVILALALAVVCAAVLLSVLDNSAKATQPVKLIPPLDLQRPALQTASRSLPRPSLGIPSKPGAASISGVGGDQTSPSAAASAASTSPSVAAVGVSTGEGGTPTAQTVWDRLAFCESRDEWSINTGNGYYGGLQEDLTFWRTYGDQRWARPDLAPKSAQIAAAVAARDSGRGYEPWPTCSKRLGLR